ncbi:MAG: transketolase [Bacillota bacterium]
MSEKLIKERKKEADLAAKALQIRLELVTMIYNAGAGHIGGSLSTVDLLVVLFYDVMKYRADYPAWPERDRFILSKGHSCEGYYAVLADCGFFDRRELSNYQKLNALLAGHPHPKVPGVEMATGSLGHGLSLAVGMALAGKMDQKNYKVYCLMGDGELAEGSVWEAAMAAAHYGLDNLVCIIDHNGLQISGPTKKVMNTDPLHERWASFGWSVQEINGHDIPVISNTFNGTPFTKGKPSLIIANTIKGRGVSFMEGNQGWHHRVPKVNEFEQAVLELNPAKK